MRSKYAQGWKQLRTNHPELKRQRAKRRDEVLGTVIMGLFGAFIVILFFYGSTCQL